MSKRDSNFVQRKSQSTGPTFFLSKRNSLRDKNNNDVDNDDNNDDDSDEDDNNEDEDNDTGISRYVESYTDDDHDDVVSKKLPDITLLHCSVVFRRQLS